MQLATRECHQGPSRRKTMSEADCGLVAVGRSAIHRLSRGKLVRCSIFFSGLLVLFTLAHSNTFAGITVDSTGRICLSKEFKNECRDMVNCSSFEELSKRARESERNSPGVREEFWQVAALSAMSDSNEALPRFSSKGMIRFITYATLLELRASGRIDTWPKDESLYQMGNSSLKALSNRYGYPSDDSLVKRFFMRRPRLSDSPLRGYWEIIELRTAGEEPIFFERSDTPIDNITSAYTVQPNTSPTPKLAVGEKNLSESARGAEFGLAALNHVIVCAKSRSALN